MAGPYTKQTWVDGSGGGTPISAARLGVIEQGIYDATHLVPTYTRLVDEFMSVNTEDGEIGELSWRQITPANGTISYDPGVTDHFGIMNCSATTTSGNIFGLAATSSPSGNGFILPTMLDTLIWILKPVSNTACNIRCGVAQDPTVAALGTDAAFWDFTVASNANWRSITRGTSSNTTNNTSVAVTSGNWYKLEIRKLTTNYEFWLNDSLKFTHSATLPSTSVPLIPFAHIEITSTTSKQIAIDWFGLQTTTTGQRWT